MTQPTMKEEIEAMVTFYAAVPYSVCVQLGEVKRYADEDVVLLGRKLLAFAAATKKGGDIKEQQRELIRGHVRTMDLMQMQIDTLLGLLEMPEYDKKALQQALREMYIRQEQINAKR